MEWIALKHALLSHLPVASGLLLPLALLAAQRPGRGIRSWWTVSRYLGWAGFLGLLGAMVSGLAAGPRLGLLPSQHLFPALVSGVGVEAQLLRHAFLAGGSLLLGGGALWAMSRPRKDHQSLGLLALALGLGWSALLLTAGESGYRLAHGRLRPHAPTASAVAAPAPLAPVDPEAERPLRALDFAALEPIHPEPVKSVAHGGRWIRAWASPEAAAAYRDGLPLPLGALVVLSSVEDRWGRPGSDPGPLYALEQKPSGPALTFYWGRIPTAHRAAFAGDSRAYWRGPEAHLDSCRTCHAEGMANPAQRSRWRARKAVSAE